MAGMAHSRSPTCRARRMASFLMGTSPSRQKSGGCPSMNLLAFRTFEHVCLLPSVGQVASRFNVRCAGQLTDCAADRVAISAAWCNGKCHSTSIENEGSKRSHCFDAVTKGRNAYIPDGAAL